MFGTLPSRRSAPAASEVLALKSNAIAMHYACTHLSGEVREGALFPALVMELLRATQGEGDGEDNEAACQYAVVRVASADGGFPVIARTAIASAPPLATGDLVLWKALEKSTATMARVADARRSWTGLICGVLAPEVMQHNGHLRLAVDYGVIR